MAYDAGKRSKIPATWGEKKTESVDLLPTPRLFPTPGYEVHGHSLHDTGVQGLRAGLLGASASALPGLGTHHVSHIPWKLRAGQP